jgi:WhiB family transcriptional regulator, redox-sensing transcriptional regulator
MIDLPQIEWTEQAWRDRAACKGEPTQIFFATQGQDVRVARSICNNCPVRLECLEWAVDASVQHGIFGGRVPRERRALRKGYRWLETCGTAAGAHRHLDSDVPLCPACLGFHRDRFRRRPEEDRSL